MKDLILDSLWISVFQNSKATPTHPHSQHTPSSGEGLGCLRGPMRLPHRPSPLTHHLRLACCYTVPSLLSASSQAPTLPTRRGMVHQQFLRKRMPQSSARSSFICLHHLGTHNSIRPSRRSILISLILFSDLCLHREDQVLGDQKHLP